ncbi:MAG: anti-sigma factor family protein [Bacillota bacterium]|jgi:hypothetical protein|nr:hypothetical protein [Candidatus Fermentithermobacillaceae bacterium]
MPVLRCPDDIRLESYFYGDLAPLEESLIRLHVGTCPKCRAKIEELRQFNAFLRLYPVEEPPMGFEDDLLRMVRSWDFGPDPVPSGTEEDLEEEKIEMSWGYKVRWAVASLVLALGSILQYKYGSFLPTAFGKGTNLLSSLQDMGALWRQIVSGAWWDGLVSVATALRTDGLASLEILQSALPSQIASVLVFGGITMVVFLNQRKASKDGGEGT